MNLVQTRFRVQNPGHPRESMKVSKLAEKRLRGWGCGYSYQRGRLALDLLVNFFYFYQ